jgi:processing peptidase subunit alpha
MGEMAEIVIKQFQHLRKGVGKTELERAKVQLKSQLLMNLEMRPVQFEDLARQMLAHGRRKTADDYAEEIDRVQSEDIVRIAHNMLESRLAFVGYGDLKDMPSYEHMKTLV